MKQTISKNLKRLRGKLRQKEVASALGIDLKRYQKWEEGKAEPPASLLVKLSEYYAVSIDRIIKEPAI